MDTMSCVQLVILSCEMLANIHSLIHYLYTPTQTEINDHAKANQELAEQENTFPNPVSMFLFLEHLINIYCTKN